MEGERRSVWGVHRIQQVVQADMRNGPQRYSDGAAHAA